MKRLRCSNCDTLFEKDRMYKDADGNWLCDQCANDTWNYPTTVVYMPSGKPIEKSEYNRIMNETRNFETGDYDSAPPDPIKSEFWKSTDAWRGYTDWTLQNGFVEYSSGWVTGMPDETTTRKADLADLYEKLYEFRLICPVDLWWIFGVTSNVFSTSTTIVVREEDKDDLVAWLEEIGADVEYMLG